MSILKNIKHKRNTLCFSYPKPERLDIYSKGSRICPTNYVKKSEKECEIKPSSSHDDPENFPKIKSGYFSFN